MAEDSARLSIIVPMLNEHASIAATLRALRAGAPCAEIIAVDGGSDDGSQDAARSLCDVLIQAPRGRAGQLNAGAARARGELLAFVHADTVVPATFADDIEAAMRNPAVVGGRFDVALDAPGVAYRLIGLLISLRSRFSRTGTGDQAIFVRRSVFQRLGGFPPIEICEDLDFTRRLKRAGTMACLRSRVVTSARRWQRAGLVRTVGRMWAIRLSYLAGVSPARLRQWYADLR
ncbi:MAG TPA: TIGR04283 family arsenosugar biosynthesis glycosyltransferase [Candidatus Binataceae bacterium]|nr:TIGR04283 family arsenosugar biosynthesis glycosyltransferase [Candidatus Binataceae bacterium]